MTITYQLEPDLSAADFRQVLIASTLGQRRPIDEPIRLEAMLRNADVIVTARDTSAADSGKLIGVSRAISDRAFATYLSDLAVAETHQGRGIGKRLIAETHQAAGLLTTLYLVAAPAAVDYYPKIGMTHNPACWKIPSARWP
jgi:predicted N-acetyltransferase YhbS